MLAAPEITRRTTRLEKKKPEVFIHKKLLDDIL